VSLAPQEPTSSLLRSGANIGKKELHGEEEEEEEEDEDFQGGQEGRRSQEAKPRRLMGKQGVASNRKMSMDVGSLILGWSTQVNSGSNDPQLQNTASPSSFPFHLFFNKQILFFLFRLHFPVISLAYTIQIL